MNEMRNGYSMWTDVFNRELFPERTWPQYDSVRNFVAHAPIDDRLRNEMIIRYYEHFADDIAEYTSRLDTDDPYVGFNHPSFFCYAKWASYLIGQQLRKRHVPGARRRARALEDGNADVFNAMAHAHTTFINGLGKADSNDGITEAHVRHGGKSFIPNIGTPTPNQRRWSPVGRVDRPVPREGRSGNPRACPGADHGQAGVEAIRTDNGLERLADIGNDASPGGDTVDLQRSSSIQPEQRGRGGTGAAESEQHDRSGLNPENSGSGAGQRQRKDVANRAHADTSAQKLDDDPFATLRSLGDPRDGLPAALLWDLWRENPDSISSPEALFEHVRTKAYDHYAKVRESSDPLVRRQHMLYGNAWLVISEQSVVQAAVSAAFRINMRAVASPFRAMWRTQREFTSRPVSRIRNSIEVFIIRRGVMPRVYFVAPKGVMSSSGTVRVGRWYRENRNHDQWLSEFDSLGAPFSYFDLPKRCDFWPSLRQRLGVILLVMVASHDSDWFDPDEPYLTARTPKWELFEPKARRALDLLAQ